MTIQNKSNKRKNTGFTLIELIVTISIASILASIAVPSFTAMIKSNNVTTGTNELVSALLLARSEALKRSNTVSVCISDDQETCLGVNETEFEKGWLVFMDCNADGLLDLAANSVDCDNDGVINDSDQLIKVHGPVDGINIAINNTGAGIRKGSVSYTFSGRSATRTFGVSPVHETADVKRVIISLTGRVRTETL